MERSEIDKLYARHDILIGRHDKLYAYVTDITKPEEKYLKAMDLLLRVYEETNQVSHQIVKHFMTSYDERTQTNWN